MTIEAPDHIRQIVPYEPGKPVEELERELGISGSIKLASNENPVGPSPSVVEALMQNAQNVNRYPDGGCFYLKEATASFLGVEPSQVVFGNGSNELIELCLKAFAQPGDETVSAAGAFVVYDLASRAGGGRSVQVPLSGFTHDLPAMARAVTPKTKAVFVANPNNPTGTMVGREEVKHFLESVPPGVLVIFDEAYREYVARDDFPDTLELIKEHANVVALRTFSKAYGLAGLRIGYAVARREVTDILNRIRQPFNVNLLAQVAALAAIKDQQHVQMVVSLCRRQRRWLEDRLGRMGLDFVPSEANFILVDVGRNGREVYDALLARGVIARPMGGYGFPRHLRVTVGLPEENDRFIEELAAVLETLPPSEVRS